MELFGGQRAVARTAGTRLLTVMEAIKCALPSLARRPGCVVNIASSAGEGSLIYPGVEYAVAKAG